MFQARMASFETFDLRRSMRTMGPFDLVFCRNVMIYFDNETKGKMIKEIHSTLFRGGWLLIGGAETPSRPQGVFRGTKNRVHDDLRRALTGEI